MNKYRALIAIMASCCCSSAVFGENLIRSLLNKVSKPSNVVTNLPKQDLGGGLYYYKIGTTASDPELSALLKRNKELRARNAALGLNGVTEETDTGHVPMTPSEIETARIAIAAQKQSAHPDNTPVQNVIDKNPQTEEPVKHAKKNEKQVMYGNGSPLQDQEVIAAWDRYHEAQKRLEDHRAYMERVRKSRKQIEHKARETASVDE